MAENKWGTGDISPLYVEFMPLLISGDGAHFVGFDDDGCSTYLTFASKLSPRSLKLRV